MAHKIYIQRINKEYYFALNGDGSELPTLSSGDNISGRYAEIDNNQLKTLEKATRKKQSKLLGQIWKAQDEK